VEGCADVASAGGHDFGLGLEFAADFVDLLASAVGDVLIAGGAGAGDDEALRLAGESACFALWEV